MSQHEVDRIHTPGAVIGLRAPGCQQTAALAEARLGGGSREKALPEVSGSGGSRGGSAPTLRRTGPPLGLPVTWLKDWVSLHTLFLAGEDPPLFPSHAFLDVSLDSSVPADCPG